MKHQVLFSLKDKSKKLKCRLLQFLFGALRVKTSPYLELFSGALHCHCLIKAVCTDINTGKGKEKKFCFNSELEIREFSDDNPELTSYFSVKIVVTPH